MKKILVATDLSSRSDRAVLRAIKLAKDYKAHLTIIHIIDGDTPESLVEETRRLAKQEVNYCTKGKLKELKHDIQIVVGSDYSEIIKVATEKDCDLIVLGLHRHVDSNQPMIGKVIERVIKNSMRPVLIVKNRAELEYKNILVGIDFNTHSKKSLKLALGLFTTSHFHLVHSYHVPFLGMAGKSSNLEQQVKASCLTEIEEMLEEITEKNSKSGKKASQSPKITKKILKGSIFDVLNDEIISLKPELLVLGSHGRSGLAKIVSLNVTENFLVNPSCDVLVVI